MVKRHVYKGELIVEFGRFDYTGFILNAEDEDIEDKDFKSLSEAQAWIDKKQEANSQSVQS